MLNVHIGDWLWNDAMTVWDSFGKLLSHTQPTSLTCKELTRCMRGEYPAFHSRKYFLLKETALAENRTRIEICIASL